MMDTDIFNLFFFLSILACLNVVASSSRPVVVIALALGAGILFQFFVLWYGYRGFLVPFVITYILLSVSIPGKIWVKITGLSAFLMSVGTIEPWGNLASFLDTYIFNRFEGSVVETASVQTVSELSARVYSTISESGSITS
jgi:hypothetical protein